MMRSFYRLLRGFIVLEVVGRAKCVTSAQSSVGVAKFVNAVNKQVLVCKVLNCSRIQALGLRSVFVSQSPGLGTAKGVIGLSSKFFGRQAYESHTLICRFLCFFDKS